MIRRLLALLLACLVLAPVPAGAGAVYVPATIESLTVSGQTTGDLIYADSTSSFTRLAGVATGNALISGGVGAAPSWGKIALTTHVSGTLPYGSGGTGATSYTTNRILKAGASAFADSLLSDDGTNVTLASGALKLPDYSGSGAAPIRGTTHATIGGIGIDSAGLTWVVASSTEGGLQIGPVASGTIIKYVGANGSIVGGSFTNSGGLLWDTNAILPAANQLLANGTVSLGITSYRWGTYFGTTADLSTPAVTAGSGTGVTVNKAGQVRELVYQVTITYANCVAAATTCDLTVATLPAKTFLKRVFADLTTTYACAQTCTTATLSGTLGTSAGGTELLASMDLDAATAQFGDADAELGASMNAAARTANGALIPGVLMSWASTTTVTFRITSGTGNLGAAGVTNLSQGSITFYLTTEVL